MARGWHYTKLSLSSALLLTFYGMYFVLWFLPCCCVFVLFRFHALVGAFFVDVPLIFSCPADHVVPEWQPYYTIL